MIRIRMTLKQTTPAPADKSPRPVRIELFLDTLRLKTRCFQHLSYAATVGAKPLRGLIRIFCPQRKFISLTW